MRSRCSTYSGYFLALGGAIAVATPSLMVVAEIAAALAEVASGESGTFSNLDLTSVTDFEDGLMVLLDVYSFVEQDLSLIFDFGVEPSVSFSQMASVLVR